jgi:hypothetical protein
VLVLGRIFFFEKRGTLLLEKFVPFIRHFSGKSMSYVPGPTVSPFKPENCL